MMIPSEITQSSPLLQVKELCKYFPIQSEGLMRKQVTWSKP